MKDKKIKEIIEDTKRIQELTKDYLSNKYDNHPRVTPQDILEDIGTCAFSILDTICNGNMDQLMEWAKAYCDK